MYHRLSLEMFKVARKKVTLRHGRESNSHKKGVKELSVFSALRECVRVVQKGISDGKNELFQNRSICRGGFSFTSSKFSKVCFEHEYPNCMIRLFEVVALLRSWICMQIHSTDTGLEGMREKKLPFLQIRFLFAPHRFPT